MTTRERLLGYQHAFDEPVVLVIVAVVVAVMLVAPLAIIVLSWAGKISSDQRRELVRRCVSWAVIVPFVVVPVLLGAAWTLAMVAVISLLCYREFARMTGLFRDRVMSAMVVLGILAITFAAADHWYGFFVALSPLMIVLIAAVAILADTPKGYIQRVGLSAFALLLFGVCLGHLGYFANDGRYRAIVLLLFLAVELNDVFAYVMGKSIGGARLAPNTSPDKTVAGAVGALVLTTLLVYVLAGSVFVGTALAQPAHRVILGLIISVAGQTGDLMMSSIKCDLGVKDTGAILPGHGGILDRFNSLLLAAPAVFHYVGYFVGVGLDQPQRIITGG